MTRRRRGRGEGAIFQRADGLWTASLSLGYNHNGKRIRRVVYGESKQEVQEKLRHLQTDASLGRLTDADKPTLSDYLSRWLEGVRAKRATHTYLPYERHVNKYIVPYLGRIRLSKLVAFHIEQLYASLERDSVSASERRKAGTTLGTALRHVVRLKLIAFNPSADVPKPKAVKREMVVWDERQVGQFLKAAAIDRLSALYLLALDSGMRQGELFGLDWNDLDLESGVVFVQRSLEEAKGQLHPKDMKSRSSRRRIDLSRRTVTALREHRKQMLVEGHIDGPVFCAPEGGYLRKSNVVRRSFLPIVKRAGVPRIRFHDLRHTCATLVLIANVNPKVVSERLGHASIQITLDTYSHVLPTMQKRAAEKMDRILRPAVAN